MPTPPPTPNTDAIKKQATNAIATVLLVTGFFSFLTFLWLKFLGLFCPLFGAVPHSYELTVSL